MKQLYIVTDRTSNVNDMSSYHYIVKANNYREAIEIVRIKTGFKFLEFDATLADNNEIWK